MIGRRSFSCVLVLVLIVFLCPDSRGLAEERYTVKPGDSLFTISKSFGVSVGALKEANGLQGNGIKPKQVLLIPDTKARQAKGAAIKSEGETETYIVKQADSLYGLSKNTGISIEEIKGLNQLQTTHLKIGQKLTLPAQNGKKEKELEELGLPAERSEISKAIKEQQGVLIPLGKREDPDDKNLFKVVAEKFLGVPYRLGGSTLKGIDCSALVKKVFDVFNVQLPRTVREQSRLGKEVERNDLQEGDLVFFKTRWASGSHVGIYIGNNEFIHASYRGRRVRVDSLDTPYFRQRFVKGVRVIESEEEI